MRRGYLYCVWNRIYERDIYKLGRAKDMERRMKTYQTYYYEPMRRLIVSEELEDYVRGERILLGRFRERRIRGEFFRIEDIEEVREEIERINKILGRRE